MADDQQVWEGTLDERYRVTVTRTAPYEGLLRVVDTEGGELLHEEEVAVNYDAILGPDVADITRWQEIAVQIVDGRGAGG